jgi:hypothetical protein
MTKKISIVALLFIIMLNILNMRVYAYWDTHYASKDIQVVVGNWTWDTPQPYIPSGYVIDIWIEENNINRWIPLGQLFSYQNKLYISIDKGGYNPQYHGLPQNGSNQWAYVSIELEWMPNTNYRVGAVVIRNGRYFIANPAYNDVDWFVGDPLNSNNKPWSEWREIQPLPDSYFGYIEDYPVLKDYRANIEDVVFIV